MKGRSLQDKHLSLRGQQNDCEARVGQLKAAGFTGEFLDNNLLVSARICQHWTVPAGELLQTAHLLDYISSGREHQMVGIAEDDLTVFLSELRWSHCLHGSFGCTKDEVRRLDVSMRRGDDSCSGL